MITKFWTKATNFRSTETKKKNNLRLPKPQKVAGLSPS